MSPESTACATTTLILGGAAPRSAGHGHDIALRALHQLRARGTRIVLTDRAENLAAAPELTVLAAEVHPLDVADTASCVAWARARGTRFDAVVGLDEYAAESVAAVADALGLSGNPLTAVRRVRTKDRCRDYLRRHGFRQPRLQLCTRPEQAEELLRAEGRVVVKPRDRAHGEGVSQVTHRAQLPAAFRAARAAESTPVLVEAWVEGTEYSVEGLIVACRPEILAVTRKHLAPGTFIETGHTMPAQLEPDTDSAVRAEVRAALQVLGLRTGPFHVECWTGPRGVVLGAVHLRQGGDWIPAMLEWCRPGFAWYGSWLDDLLGTIPQIPPTTRAAAVRFALSPPGTVRDVHGWQHLDALPGVLAAECPLAPGDRLGAPRANRDRRGAVVVGAADAPAADRAADDFLARLSIEMTPPALKGAGYSPGRWGFAADRPGP
ncbi:ATP-grasp domain-containing protein [Streptomyces sp. NPDC048483]|uniref:ATP-grasp domain-containing protein n=1 Tax=Streptomyces sp. NPDC048483 TaxID=3154927 RepID=UPI00341A190C